MEIILKNDLTETNDRGDTIVLLTAGTRISAINISYIAKSSKIEPFSTNLYDIEHINKRYFIIYAKGKLRAISKDDVEIPKTRNNGWTQNF